MTKAERKKKKRKAVTYENGNVLEAIRLPSILRNTHLIPEHKGNLDNPRQPRRHQGISKRRVHRGTCVQLLRMRRHTPASNKEHKPRNKVALRVAVPIAAKPDARKTGAPPNDTHSGMLPVVLNPISSPSMLCERVDAAPSSNDAAIIKLLRPPSASDPKLPHNKEDGQQDTVGDECAAHDKVRKTLTQMIALAEPQCRDAAEDHLHPRNDGESLPENAVGGSHKAADTAVDALFKVQLKVDADGDLGGKDEE